MPRINANFQSLPRLATQFSLDNKYSQLYFPGQSLEWMFEAEPYRLLLSPLRGFYVYGVYLWAYAHSYVLSPLRGYPGFNVFFL